MICLTAQSASTSYSAPLLVHYCANSLARIPVPAEPTPPIVLARCAGVHHESHVHACPGDEYDIRSASAARAEASCGALWLRAPRTIQPVGMGRYWSSPGSAAAAASRAPAAVDGTLNAVPGRFTTTTIRAVYDLVGLLTVDGVTNPGCSGGEHRRSTWPSAHGSPGPRPPARMLLSQSP